VRPAQLGAAERQGGGDADRHADADRVDAAVVGAADDGGAAGAGRHAAERGGRHHAELVARRGAGGVDAGAVDHAGDVERLAVGALDDDERVDRAGVEREQARDGLAGAGGGGDRPLAGLDRRVAGGVGEGDALGQRRAVGRRDRDVRGRARRLDEPDLGLAGGRRRQVVGQQGLLQVGVGAHGRERVVGAVGQGGVGRHGRLAGRVGAGRAQEERVLTRLERGIVGHLAVAEPLEDPGLGAVEADDVHVHLGRVRREVGEADADGRLGAGGGGRHEREEGRHRRDRQRGGDAPHRRAGRPAR
jgi:hypothetical protein